MASTSTRFVGIILGSVVFAVGTLGELVGELLLLFAFPSMMGIVQGRLIADAVLTTILTLGTLIAVYTVCRRSLIRSLSTGTIGGIALLSGILGRYAGIILGRVFRGGQIPTPVVLVTNADLAVGLNDIGLVVVVLFGIATTGLWSLVGTFGGIGLASLSTFSR